MADRSFQNAAKATGLTLNLRSHQRAKNFSDMAQFTAVNSISSQTKRHACSLMR